ncbi:MAG: cytochrome c [Proteobacteria bacterium]|nr:cytochrome c [Pseudomonadota bacterium]MCP4920673.1 cytochrome c [Pseudomonadota bacterium]
MIALLLGLGLGCGDKDPAGDSAVVEADADTDADSDTDTDTDADADSDSDTDADPVRGEQIYQQTCGSDYCHGGDTIHDERVPVMTDDEIRTVMIDGYNYMPAQGLPAHDVENVLSYLRQEYGGG